jgi:hypothetical protein
VSLFNHGWFRLLIFSGNPKPAQQNLVLRAVDGEVIEFLHALSEDTWTVHAAQVFVFLLLVVDAVAVFGSESLLC